MSQRKVQLHISRFFALALAALLLLPTLPAAFAAESGGACGNGVNWTLSGGVLTVSGSGAMENYSEQSPAPWQPYKDSVRAVVVEKGVKSVGECAFLQMDKITCVTLASSVKRVGDWAFGSCYELALLDLGSVEEIGESAFERCYALTAVRLPDTLRTLRYRAFYDCAGLVSVTVPASVTAMETSVFAHCASLQNATVLAGISELPSWTFYKCVKLACVTMAPTIYEVGYDAFLDCAMEEPDYGHSGQTGSTVTTTQQQNGATVTTNSSVVENGHGTVTSQTTITKTDTDKTVDVVIDAVLESSDGWQDVVDQVNDGLKNDDGSVSVDVWVKGDAILSGDDLAQFAGKDVQLVIHTNQGAAWHVNGQDLNEKELSRKYDLSFILRSMTDPDEAQSAVLGDCQAFTVEFNKDVNFKVEVELPLGNTLARNTAVFFDHGKEGYTRAQTVLIDNEGVARFYLAKVAAGTEYLIGINVPVSEDASVSAGSVSDAIIPSTMTNEYPNLQQVEQIEYVVTGVKTPLDMNIQQLTIIIVAVLVVSFIVVGFVIFAMNKRKLKNGYVPVLDDEEE